MNKKLVALILSISLFNSFIMGCNNDKKDVSHNSNVNKIDKKTFDEVIEKFNDEHTLMLNEIKKSFKAQLKGEKENIHPYYDNLIEILDSSLKDMKELLYFKGEEKEFIKKSIEYFKTFKAYANSMLDIEDSNKSISSEVEKLTNDLLEKREECKKIINELGYKYDDGSDKF